MRKSSPAKMKKRQKNRCLLGKAGVTPYEGEKTLSFIDNRIISSPEVAASRPADPKNDLSKSAGIIKKFDIFNRIGNSQKLSKNTSIPKTANQNTGP